MVRSFKNWFSLVKKEEAFRLLYCSRNAQFLSKPKSHDFLVSPERTLMSYDQFLEFRYYMLP